MTTNSKNKGVLTAALRSHLANLLESPKPKARSRPTIGSSDEDRIRRGRHGALVSDWAALPRSYRGDSRGKEGERSEFEIKSITRRTGSVWHSLSKSQNL